MPRWTRQPTSGHSTLSTTSRISICPTIQRRGGAGMSLRDSSQDRSHESALRILHFAFCICPSVVRPALQRHCGGHSFRRAAQRGNKWALAFRCSRFHPLPSSLRHLRHVHVEAGLRQQRRQRKGFEAISVYLRVTINSWLILNRFPPSFHIRQELLRLLHAHVFIFRARYYRL